MMNQIGPDQYLRFMHCLTKDVLNEFNPTNTPLSMLPVIDFWSSDVDPRDIMLRPDCREFTRKNKFEASMPPFTACWVKVLDHCALVRANKESLQFAVCSKLGKNGIDNGVLRMETVKGMGYPFVCAALSEVKKIEFDGLNMRYQIKDGTNGLVLDLDPEDRALMMKRYGLSPMLADSLVENCEMNLSKNYSDEWLQDWRSLSDTVIAALCVTNFLLSRRSIEKAERKAVTIPDSVKLFEEDRQQQKKIVKNLKEYTFEHVTILSTDPPKRVPERNIDRLYAREPYQIHTPAWLVAEHTRAPAKAHERHMKDGRVIQVREGSHTATVAAHVNQHKGVDTPKPAVTDFKEIYQVWDGRGR